MSLRTSEGVLNEYEIDELIVKNIHLVNVIAKKYSFIDRNKHDDLIQEGRIGLIKAARKFKSKNGIKFETYASYHIKYSIQDFLRKESTLVHIPHNRLCKAYRLLRFINSHTQKNNGAPPSRSEMKGFLFCNDEYLGDIIFIIEILNNQFEQLDQIRIIKKNQIHEKILIRTILSFVDILPKEEKNIIKEKHLKNKSFREISKSMDISHETVRKIHNKTIKKLRELTNKLKE